MSDINRGGIHPIVEKNLDLKIKHYKILLNEKKGQVKALEARLEQLKSVEFKKVELAIDVATREVQGLESDIRILEKGNVIDVTILENKK